MLAHLKTLKKSSFVCGKFIFCKKKKTFLALKDFQVWVQYDHSGLGTSLSTSLRSGYITKEEMLTIVGNCPEFDGDKVRISESELIYTSKSK